MFKGKRQSFGTAIHFLKGHKMVMGRYLNEFYPVYDWNIIKSFFWENPIQSKVILKDFSLSNDAKLEKVCEIFTDGKSKIIYIIGGRGSGKTATAFMIAETIHKRTGQHTYYVAENVNEKALPDWCHLVPSISKVPNGKLAIIDESGIQFNAREYKGQANIEMSKELMIARHKDLSLIFLTQHASLSDTNIQRLRDLVIWKMSNDYTPAEKGTTRSKEHNFWKKVRQMMSPRHKSACLFEFPMMRRFIYFEHNLPECWSEELSKTWKNRNKEEVKVSKATKEALYTPIQSPY